MTLPLSTPQAPLPNQYKANIAQALARTVTASGRQNCRRDAHDPVRIHDELATIRRGGHRGLLSPPQDRAALRGGEQALCIAVVERFTCRSSTLPVGGRLSPGIARSCRVQQRPTRKETARRPDPGNPIDADSTFGRSTTSSAGFVETSGEFF